MEEFDLIKELKNMVQLQTNLAKLRMVTGTRKAKSEVEAKIKGVGEYLDEQAKNYGQEKEKVKSLKAEHKGNLQEIYEQYTCGVCSFEAKRQEIESEELESIGKMGSLAEKIRETKKTVEYKAWKEKYDGLCKSAETYRKAGNREKFDAIMNEIKEEGKQSPVYEKQQALRDERKNYDSIKKRLNENKQNQEELKNNLKKMINDAVNGKNKQMEKIKKQNFFQRFIGAISSKIGGAKKFTNNVLNPIKRNLDEFKNKAMPAFIKDISDKVGDKFKIVSGFGKSVKSRIDGVINNGKRAKDDLIASLAKSIKDKNEKTQEKISKLEEKDKGEH